MGFHSKLTLMARLRCLSVSNDRTIWTNSMDSCSSNYSHWNNSRNILTKIIVPTKSNLRTRKHFFLFIRFKAIVFRKAWRRLLFIPGFYLIRSRNIWNLCLSMRIRELLVNYKVSNNSRARIQGGANRVCLVAEMITNIH